MSAADSPAGSPHDADQRIRELEEAVAARDQFLSVVGHELRNPILPIALQAELLRCAADQGDFERLKTGLPRLQASVEQFVRRSTVLLDVSRLLSGRFALEPVAMDLVPTIRTVVDRFADALRIAELSLVLAVPDSLPGVFDPMAVEQITENLVSNAIKYGDSRPIEVGVRQEGDEAVLIVRDNGIGIAPEDQERIFGRFERAVDRRAHGGFGVGLWVVERLVTTMQGRITLDSATGAGAVFTVRLPLRGERTPA